MRDFFGIRHLESIPEHRHLAPSGMPLSTLPGFQLDLQKGTDFPQVLDCLWQNYEYAPLLGFPTGS